MGEAARQTDFDGYPDHRRSDFVYLQKIRKQTTGTIYIFLFYIFGLQRKVSSQC